MARKPEFMNTKEGTVFEGSCFAIFAQIKATINNEAVIKIEDPNRDETSALSKSVVAIEMKSKAGMKISAATVARVFESISVNRPMRYPARITTSIGSMWRNGAIVMGVLYWVSYRINKWRMS